MPLPLLEYAPTSQNTRVSSSFDIPGDEQPRVFTVENILSSSEIEGLIEAAYLQIFHEQKMLDFYRQTSLESLLTTGQITVKDFIRGLATSDAFRRINYDVNNNYRFSEICVQRILGRQVYNDRERIAWSIVLATKGLTGFIDELLESDEYNDNFGEYTVPYQRRRILSQRTAGDVTFAHVPSYGPGYTSKPNSGRVRRPSPSRSSASTTRIQRPSRSTFTRPAASAASAPRPAARPPSTGRPAARPTPARSSQPAPSTSEGPVKITELLAPVILITALVALAGAVAFLGV